MKTFNLSEFASRLKDLRKENGIGQNDLAKLLELSNSSISYWENAKQEPSASALCKLAQYFDVSVDYLLGLDD